MYSKQWIWFVKARNRMLKSGNFLENWTYFPEVSCSSYWKNDFHQNHDRMTKKKNLIYRVGSIRIPVLTQKVYTNFQIYESKCSSLYQKEGKNWIGTPIWFLSHLFETYHFHMTDYKSNFHQSLAKSMTHFQEKLKSFGLC